MGANNSTRRVSFESDENDNITVVKGIRLSENVIKRMREPADSPKQQHAPTSPPSMASAPLLRPVPPLFDPITSLPPAPPLVEPVASPPSPPPPPAPPATETPPPPPSPQPPTEKPTGVPVPEPVAKSSPVPPPAASQAVNEEALRKKITDELHKSLEQDRAKAEQELQAWLQSEKARSSAQIQAKAQSQVQDEVARILSLERGASQESFQQSLARERIVTEDTKRRVQLYAKQLEAREAELKKQDAFYRDQVAKLEERSAQFYKSTTESYHKAADEVNAKFKRYEVYPVCADLQGQILACYKENVGKTLNCSNIAALYMQCVNEAKQNKLRTGG